MTRILLILTFTLVLASFAYESEAVGIFFNPFYQVNRQVKVSEWNVSWIHDTLSLPGNLGSEDHEGPANDPGQKPSDQAAKMSTLLPAMEESLLSHDGFWILKDFQSKKLSHICDKLWIVPLSENWNTPEAF